MREALLRLGSISLLLGLNANAASSPFTEGSAVIVRPEKLISSNRINATDLNNANAPITEWTNDAEFTVTHQLSGPDLGKDARISFVDQHSWHPGKMFMIVHRDGLGRLWARRAWQEVDSQLCLSAQQVETLGLTAAFTTSQSNDEGQRCIKV